MEEQFSHDGSQGDFGGFAFGAQSLVVGLDERVVQRDFGGPERWQEHATHQWIDQLLTLPEALVVIEGQTRPQFVLAAFQRAKVVHGGVLLLDCGFEERRRRLQIDRAQPELANFHMFAWAAYLRGRRMLWGFQFLTIQSLAKQRLVER